MPAGPMQRRRRLSDEETERRMLDAALAMVNRSGLTVGLDHISFEDVIRDAGVSRTAVYRRWPYKDLFFSDMLRELAEGTGPAGAVTEQNTLPLLRSVLAGRLGDLESSQGQRDLVSEMLRLAAVNDFEALHNSPEWRTYLALQATFLSLPGGALRDEIKASLATSEKRFIDQVARGWEQMAAALSYRLRPDSGASFELIAILAIAHMRGLVLMALADEELLARRVHANPTGARSPADWSLSSMGAASFALTFLEPDPDVTWDAERIAALRALLASGSDG